MNRDDFVSDDLVSVNQTIARNIAEQTEVWRQFIALISLQQPVSSPLVVLRQATPDDGGQINLQSAINSTISGDLAIELFDDFFAIFESSGAQRGGAIDITQCANGGITDLLPTYPMFYNTTAPVAAGSTVFIGVNGSSATESLVELHMPRSGIIKGIAGATTVAPGVGQTFTYTVRKGGVDQTMTYQTTGTSFGGSTTSNQVSFVAFDRISVKLVTSAGAGVATHRSCMQIQWTV